MLHLSWRARSSDPAGCDTLVGFKEGGGDLLTFIEIGRFSTTNYQLTGQYAGTLHIQEVQGTTWEDGTYRWFDLLMGEHASVGWIDGDGPHGGGLDLLQPAGTAATVFVSQNHDDLYLDSITLSAVTASPGGSGFSGTVG